jgi:hypothetical protein
VLGKGEKAKDRLSFSLLLKTGTTRASSQRESLGGKERRAALGSWERSTKEEVEEGKGGMSISSFGVLLVDVEALNICRLG